MNLGNFKYKSLLLGVGASLMLATSCKDFLDVDVYDNYSPATLSSKGAYQSLTYPLFGGYKWFEYEGKFSWCVNEGLSGILANKNGDEGILFQLSIGENNTILKEGYTSLYSGVIAHANSVISVVSDSLNAGAIPMDMTEAEMRAVLAEARFFRGYAHFLASEYFGEVPLVMNSEKDITSNAILPCVSRKTIYRAVEDDLLYAKDNLPESGKLSKYAAESLLAKLYLTMASCQTSTPGISFPYVCDNPSMYLDSAINLLNSVVTSNKFTLASHKDIFCAQPLAGAPVESSEDIFSLYWLAGGYGEGSAYQSQIAPSSVWSPGSGWGGGKGLTYTLYNSFAENDARKKELCFYVGSGTGNVYQLVSGEEVCYGSDFVAKGYKKGQSGKDFLAGGLHLMNNIKKYVWGVDGTSKHGSGMSISRVQHVIRYSDVKMMLAEAEYLKAYGTNVTEVTTNSAIIGPINEVLTAHGAPTIESISYFTDYSSKHDSGENFVFNVTVDDGNGGSTTKSITVNPDSAMYHTEIRADLVQQRRKEFAMEGHGWLDLKRFYYLNPEMAAKFMWQMDRSCSWTNSPEVPENSSALQNETGYARLALVNKCNEALAKMFPEGSYKAGDPEIEVFTQSFLDRNRWYLPIPTSAKIYLSGVKDMYQDVVNGTYPY